MQSFTIERTATIALFVLLFALAARIPIDTDVWWHIRSGEYTLTQGMIYADPFSFTMRGEAWTNHSWGAQIILYGIWRLAGDFGLAIYTAGLATAGMYVIYRACSGSVYLRGFALILGAATAAVFWSPRPQMWSFLFSAVVFLIIHLYKRKQIDKLWLLPPLMAIWGNLHAGFSIGFILLLGTIAGEVANHLFNPRGAATMHWRGVRKLALVTIVSVAALVINPYGLQMLAVPFQTLGIGALRDFIVEWRSPNFHQIETWPFVVLLLGLLGAVGASKARIDWTEYLLCAGTAFMGLLAGRNIALFAVVATPVLTYHLVSILEERGWVLQPLRRVSARMGLINTLLLAVISLGALAKVLLVLDRTTVAEAKAEHLPIAAVEYLRRNPPQSALFNSYNWGGYLIYAAPDIPVFIDGRTDLYGDAMMMRFLRTVTGDGWRETFEQYAIDTVMIEPSSGLAAALRSDPDWQVAFEDDQAIIFRQDAS